MTSGLLGLLVVVAGCAEGGELPGGGEAAEIVAACLAADDGAHLCTLDRTGATDVTDLGIDPGQRLAPRVGRGEVLVVRDGRPSLVDLGTLEAREVSDEVVVDPAWLTEDVFVAWFAEGTSPDGDTVATTVLVGDVTDRTSERVDLSGHLPPGATALRGGSARDGVVAQPYAHGTGYGVVVVDLRGARVLGSLDLEVVPSWTAVAGDGSVVVTDADGGLRVVDPAGATLVELTEDVPLVTPSVSADGREVLYVDARGALVLLDLDRRESRAVVDQSGGDLDDFPAFAAWLG
ncbi:MAG: hypothetical protein AB7L84_09910 [Acidimicrobiia bacterium]